MNIGDLDGLQREIEKTKSKVGDIRGQINSLEAEASGQEKYLAGLETALKILTKNANKNLISVKQGLRPGTELAQVRDILIAAGKAFHIDQILDQLHVGKKELSDVDLKQKKASLSGTLNAYSRKGRIFTKLPPNSFGLIELESSENRENNEN